ncbi:MAG: energy-coupled thiamine transporter ThiT [Eubacteriales bacterium]|nr:energy-coupled thiamine transporter ThiT [Eubacteriales bacterium]
MIGIIVLLILFMVVAAFLFGKKSNVKFNTKQLVFSAVSIAIAFALSYVKLFSMPWGGSITLCSMLFVCLVGYFYGQRMGLTAALCYGLLQLLQDGGSYIIHPFQLCCDYLFSFMALGLSGFFANKKNGLVIGYLVGILGRLVFLSLGGYIFWMSYMPESFPASLSAIYPIVYNGSFIAVEGVITIIIISIPAVSKAIKKIKLSYING